MTRIRQLWDLFVLAENSSYEKSTWCDIFMCQFLVSLHDNNADTLSFWSSRNGVGTLIACELLSDIEQVCSQPGDGEDLQPLKRYLLARAWKPLVTLISLGEQNLSCSYELANLLISLFPICLETSGSSSEGTTAKKNKYLRLNATYELDGCFSCSPLTSKYLGGHGQGVSRIEHFRSHVTMPSNRNRKSSRGSSCTRWINDFESSESENGCDDLNVVNKSCALKLKVDVTDYFSCVVHSGEESNGGGGDAFDPVLYHPRRRARQSKKISPLDFIDERVKDVMKSQASPFEFSMLIIELLTSLCRSEHCFGITTDNSYSVCLKSVKFALEHLCSIQFGSVLGSTLGTREAANLKCALTHLLVTSLEKIMGCPDVISNVIVTGILPMTMKVLEDSVSKLSCNLNFSDEEEKYYEKEKQHEVIFGLICSVICFLCNLVTGNPDGDKVRNFLELFKLFIESNNGKLIEKTVVVLARDGKTGKAKRVIELIGELVIELKEVRRNVTCPPFNKRVRSKKVKNGIGTYHHHNRHHNHHHHHDIFGSVFTAPAVGSNIPQNCCISSLFLVLIRLLGKAYDMPPGIVNRTLKVMNLCGTCCCFKMKNLLRPFAEIIKSPSQRSRSLVFQLLETTLYRELGCFETLPDSQVKCFVCLKHTFEGTEQEGSLNETSDVDAEASYLGSPGGESHHSPAFKLTLFRELLASEDFKIVQAVTSHLLKCAPKMSHSGKCTLLFDIFLPTFLTSKLKLVLERDDISAFKIMSSLSAFSTLLNGFAFAHRFVIQKGIHHVMDLLSTKIYTEKCCLVLEKTIIFTASATPPADTPDFSLLAIFKRSVDEANALFFGHFPNMDTTTMDHVTNIVENTAVFWRTYANFALHSPALRRYFSEQTFQEDCSLLLKTAVRSLRSTTISEKQQELETSSSSTCWLMKLIESLLIFSLATGTKEENGGEEECTVTRNPFQDVPVDELKDVDIRRLAEVLLKCSLVQASRYEVVPSDSVPKYCFISLRNSCVDVGDENDEEEQVATESDSLEDNYVTADEGYDADVEVRDNVGSPGETGDGNLAGDSARFFCENPYEKNMEQRNGHTIVYPNLCLFAVDLLIKSYREIAENKYEKREANWNSMEEDLSENLFKEAPRNGSDLEPCTGFSPSPGTHLKCSRGGNGSKRTVTDTSVESHHGKEANCPGNQDKSLAGLISVLQRILFLCKESPENCLLLCKHRVIFKLLTGFGTCFTDRRNALSELQKVILDLFSILAKYAVTPKELSIYLSFFKHDNPPLDYLLSPLLSLVSSSSPQPGRYLRFPAVGVNDSADRKPVDFGKRMHNIHRTDGVDSCWSAAALSLPISPEWNWSPWAHGFSLSIWLKMEKSTDKRPLTKGKHNSHGDTADVALAPESHGSAAASALAPISSSTHLTRRSLYLGSSKQVSSPKRFHLFSLGNDHLTIECWLAVDLESFVWKLSRPDGQKGYEIIAERTFEHQIPPGKWTHLAINVKTSSSRKSAGVEIGVFSNGRKEALACLPHSGAAGRRPRTSSLLLGAQADPSLKDPVYFGSLMLFACPVFTREMAVYLLALGPSSGAFANGLVGCPKPNFTSVFPMKTLTNEVNWEAVLEPRSELIRSARSQLLLTYSAEHPRSVNMYPVACLGTGTFSFVGMRSRTGVEFGGLQAPVTVKPSLLSSLDELEYRGLGSAACVLGGSAALMFLLARVMEISNTPEEEEKIVFFLLKFVQSDYELFTQFVKNEHYNMLHKVFSAKKWRSGAHIVKAVLNVSCDKPVIKNMGNEFEVVHRCESVIVNSFLIPTMLSSWKDWNSPSQANQVFSLLLSGLLALVRDEHPYREFNAFQLNRMELVGGLLSFCKERHLFDEIKLVSANVSSLLVELVKSLMSAPPQISHISALMDCLVLLHPANATFITHVRTSFYLTLAPSHTYISPEEAEVVGNTPGVPCRFSDTWMVSLHSEPEVKNQIKQELAQSIDLNFFHAPIAHLQLNGSEKKRPLTLRNEQCKREPSNWHTFAEDIKETSHSKSVGTSTGAESNARMVTEDGTRAHENLRCFMSDLCAETLPNTRTRPSDGGETKEGTSIGRERESVCMEEKRSAKSIVVEGLLLLLKDILLMLPDSMTSQVLNHVVKPEILLVLANEKDGKVRSAVVKVFSSYLQRCSVEEVNKFVKLRGFYHLANQISLFPACPGLLEACLQLLTRSSVFPGNEDSLAEPRFATASLPVLLALMPRCVHDASLARNLISTVSRIYSKDEHLSRVLLEMGLVESLLKALVVFAHFDQEAIDEPHRDAFWTDLGKFLVGILSRALSGPGASNTQVFTDMLLEMHYVMGSERENCGIESKCTASIREVFSKVLEKALDILQKVASVEKRQKCTSSVVYSGANGIDNEGSRVKGNLTNGFGTQGACASPNLAQVSRFLSKNELCERMKLLVVSAVEFVTLTEDSTKSNRQTEISFVYYILPTLVQLLSSNMDKRNADGGGVFWPAKDFLRAETLKLLIWMMCPGQTLRVRAFAVSVFASQAENKNLLLGLLATSSQATRAFAVYLSDMMANSKLSNGDLKNCLEIKEAIREEKSLLLWPAGNEASTWMKTRDGVLAEADRQGGSWRREVMAAAVKCYSKYNWMMRSMGEEAIAMTRLVVDAQNAERKAFMGEMKLRCCKEVHLGVKWKELMSRLTHEKAVWHFESLYPGFWELDSTEGPSRVRKRLARCNLELDERYLVASERHKLKRDRKGKPLAFLFREEEKSRASAVLIENLHSNEKIKAMFSASIVTPAAEVSGEVLLGETSIYFVADDRQVEQQATEVSTKAWLFRDVKEIHTRRFELQERAIELFLTNGRTYLIALDSSGERDALMEELSGCELPNRVIGDSMVDVMQLWREGLMTNWEYLTHLNKLAGRSYNDLMQYPVYPFVLSDYSSSTLDLRSRTIYRNFKKPMAVQEKKNEQHYINNYNELLSGLKQVSLNKEPYHYGSHYSNSGTVLHFLVRLPPFTKMLLQYQDRNFDLPDRTFHSLHTTWRLASSESTTDVKEMIPEFFFLPEFLLNFQGFNFGVRQNGETVNDVVLPPWCKGDPRRFVLIHRQALESDYVTENLPHWIDLVFGFKQTGKAAVEAINVFHPATYSGFDVGSIADPLERTAWDTMVKTYGQTPKQLLKTPHPFPARPPTSLPPPMPARDNGVDGLKGLKWGHYVGSPAEADPVIVWRQLFKSQESGAPRLVPLATNDVLGLPQRSTALLQYTGDKTTTILNLSSTRPVLVSWGHQDGIVRAKWRKDYPAAALVCTSALDPVTVCCSEPGLNHLWMGHASGNIHVYRFDFVAGQELLEFSQCPVALQAHKEAVMGICISRPFSVVVTSGLDGQIIIWDLNNTSYVRSLSPTLGAVNLIAVSDTLGDVASVAGPNVVRLHTINAAFVGSLDLEETITCISFSRAPEGISVNVVACGLASGVIRLLSTWDLSPLREISHPTLSHSVTSLAYSSDSLSLYASYSDGTVVTWETSPGRPRTKTSKFFNLTL